MNERILYFDESGYTGENLLNEKQSTFAYSSVNISPEDARKFVEGIIQKYKIQNGELKTVKLIRREKGRKAILEVLEYVKEKCFISVHDKKFALCAKFFEYIIEPFISEKNSIFYGLNFHYYIANVLHVSYVCDDPYAIRLIQLFERLMREKEENYLSEIISLPYEFDSSHKTYDVMTKLVKFINVFYDEILENIKSLPDWTVDLSITSLNALFSTWGCDGKSLVAYCDFSKPINDQQELFSNMIGHEEIIYSPYILNENGEQIPLTYNLKEINLVDSKKFHGVQLADVLSSSVAFCFQQFQEVDDFVSEVRSILSSKLVYGSVYPNYDYMNLESIDVQLNACIFEELIDRATQGISLLSDIESFIEIMHQGLKKTRFDLEINN